MHGHGCRVARNTARILDRESAGTAPRKPGQQHLPDHPATTLNPGNRSAGKSGHGYTSTAISISPYVGSTTYNAVATSPAVLPDDKDVEPKNCEPIWDPDGVSHSGSAQERQRLDRSWRRTFRECDSPAFGCLAGKGFYYDVLLTGAR